MCDPLLFNLCTADLDKYMEKRGIRGVKLRKERVWSLAYADNIIVLANNRITLMDMMDPLNRFLKERKLISNVDKTKVLVFNKKGKEKKKV